MSLYAIREALRGLAAIIDPITANLIIARRDAAIAGEPSTVTPDMLLADSGVDVVETSDALSLTFVADALDAYARPVKPRVYLCHPFSAPTAEARAANIRNARRWLRWFVDNTTWAIGMPWVEYVEELDEATYRERGIEDDKALIEGHTLLVCVTNLLTTGMQAEYRHARSCAIDALDFTAIPEMTFEPPAPGSSLATVLRAVIAQVAPGTLRPVDAFGVPVRHGAQPRVDGCPSNECEIRNACTGHAGCPR